MKSLKSILVAAMAVALIASISSCGGGMKKNLTKKWQMTLSQADQDTMKAKTDRANAEMKAMDDSIAAYPKPKDSLKVKEFQSHKDMIKAFMPSDEMMDMSKNTVEFMEDGSVVMNMMGQEMKGKWSLLESDKKLVMTKDGDEKSDTSMIIELTADKMTLGHGADDKHPMTFIPAGGGESTEAKEGEKTDSAK